MRTWTRISSFVITSLRHVPTSFYQPAGWILSPALVLVCTRLDMEQVSTRAALVHLFSQLLLNWWYGSPCEARATLSVSTLAHCVQSLSSTQLSLPGFRLELHDSLPGAAGFTRYESGTAPCRLHKVIVPLSCQWTCFTFTSCWVQVGCLSCAVEEAKKKKALWCALT
jgi:hypothetical protein